MKKETKAKEHYKAINVNPKVYEEVDKMRERERIALKLDNLSWNDYMYRLLALKKESEAKAV